MRKLIVFSFLFLYLCRLNAQTSHKGFIIKGRIDEVKDNTIIKLVNINQQTCLDSAFTKNGNFVLKGFVFQPTLCWLQCNDEYAIIVVENTRMAFSSPYKNMRLENRTTGGKEQAIQNQLEQLQYPYELRSQNLYDSLNNKYYKTNEDKERMIDQYNQSSTLSQNVYVNFGKAHPNSYVGLDILYRNRQSIAKDSLNKIYHNITIQYRNTSLAKALKSFLNDELIQTGKPFIDFTAKTIDRKNFTLSNIKGKYIYLSFWSAGCGPCRFENRLFSEKLNELPKDLAIVSFSLDKNLDDWAAASKIDKISWYNVSDLQGDMGKIKTLYNVQAIPHAFLIDKNGIVVKQFIGYETTLIDDIKSTIDSMNNMVTDPR